jgi:hypothetical protein
MGCGARRRSSSRAPGATAARSQQRSLHTFHRLEARCFLSGQSSSMCSDVFFVTVMQLHPRSTLPDRPDGPRSASRAESHPHPLGPRAACSRIPGGWGSASREWKDKRVSRTWAVRVVVAPLVSVGLTAPLFATAMIYDILTKGSKWTLNVDGEVGTLKLLGGRGSRTSEGGWEMTMDVEWQGRAGTLRGWADGDNSEQRVTLDLDRSGGFAGAGLHLAHLVHALRGCGHRVGRGMRITDHIPDPGKHRTLFCATTPTAPGGHGPRRRSCSTLPPPRSPRDVAAPPPGRG